MAKRIAVVPRVEIYNRKGGVWWIDIHQNNKRTRKSLNGTNQAKALTLAHALADEILNQEWNVSLSTSLTIEKAIERYKESTFNHGAGTKDNITHILLLSSKEIILSPERLVVLSPIFLPFPPVDSAPRSTSGQE